MPSPPNKKKHPQTNKNIETITPDSDPKRKRKNAEEDAAKKTTYSA